MRIYLAFIAYFVACMFASALLLPWLQPLFSAWFDATPDRSLYRFGMLLTALGLPFFLLRAGLRNRVTIGWVYPPGGAWSVLARGLLLGSAMLLLVILGLLALGVRELETDKLQVGRILAAVLSGLASGLAVGLIEEFFFRGPLQGGMRRSQKLWVTAILIGLLYSVVHFIRPTPLQGDELNVATSVGMLLGGLGHLGDFSVFGDSFVTLLVAGIFLSMTRERTGGILLAIGIHAGWVMIIRVTKAITDTNHESEWIWLIGDYDNVTGWFASLLIAVVAVAYWRKTASKRY